MKRQITAAILLLLFPVYVSASTFGPQTGWTVRTSGNNTNGGAFDPGVVAPGTDGTLTSAVAYTDIVVGGTTTQITSVLHPFSSTSPGNFINITSGAGCTTGWFEIVSVSGSTATLNSSAGTGASVCSGNYGGSLLTIQQAYTNIVTNNGETVWCSGSYTITSGTTFTSNVAVATIGFTSAKGDGGNCTITTATNSVNIFTDQGGVPYFFQNLILSNTAGTPLAAFSCQGNGEAVTMDHVKMTGFKIAADGATGGPCRVLNLHTVDISGSTVTAVSNTGITLIDGASNIHGNTSTGSAGTIYQGGSVSSLTMIDSLCTGNTGECIEMSGNAGSLFVKNNTFYNNTGDCIDFQTGSNTVTIENNIFDTCGGFGIDAANSGQLVWMIANNAGRNNTSGNYSTFALSGGQIAQVTNVGWISPSVSPFTNASGGNFALNSTAGGGAACKAAGIPGAFPGGLTTGYIDVGAAQSQASAGGATGPYGYVQ